MKDPFLLFNEKIARSLSFFSFPYKDGVFIVINDDYISCELFNCIDYTDVI